MVRSACISILYTDRKQNLDLVKTEDYVHKTYYMMLKWKRCRFEQVEIIEKVKNLVSSIFSHSVLKSLFSEGC